MFEDVYHEAGNVLSEMPMKNFDKGYKMIIDEKTFDEMKFAYRSTTSYIFKSIH